MHNYKEINNLLVEGGSRLAEHKSVLACELWLEAWEKIKQIMEAETIHEINDVDELYEWCECMMNFTQDLVDELHNAGVDEPLFFQKRIKFCEELIERTTDDLIINNTRCAIAETRFFIGEHDEAFRNFENIVKDSPNCVCGYLNWAACYVYDMDPPNYEEATKILERALENPDIDDIAEARATAKEFFEQMNEDMKLSPSGAKLQRLTGLVKPLELDQAIKNIQKFNEIFAKDEVVCIREYRDKAIPVLLEFIAAATTIHKNAEVWHEDLEYHMYAMFLLAEFAVHEAFPLFIEILELDDETCDRILGDHLTESMGSLVGSVATIDDIERIKAVVENTKLDTYQRLAALNALIVMNTRGIYARNDLLAFLGHLLDTYSDDFDFLNSVVAYCHEVSGRTLFPRIRKLYKEKAVDPYLLREEDYEFDPDIPEEQEALHNVEKLKYLQPITDTIESMSWWACFKDEERDKQRELALNALWDNIPMAKAVNKEMEKRKEKDNLDDKIEYSATPIVKGAKVGRNEPCPCGSGKKYKKCCLDK